MTASYNQWKEENRYSAKQSYADFQRHNAERSRRDERGLDKSKKMDAVDARRVSVTANGAPRGRSYGIDGSTDGGRKVPRVVSSSFLTAMPSSRSIQQSRMSGVEQIKACGRAPGRI